MPSHTQAPSRELPEFLRSWDGRPSEFHEHRLAYLAPAPYPPEHKAAALKSRSRQQQQPHKQRTVSDQNSKRRSLLRPFEPTAEQPAIVTAADINAILAFSTAAFENGATVLAHLQDQAHKALRRAAEAKAKREEAQQRQADADNGLSLPPEENAAGGTRARRPAPPRREQQQQQQQRQPGESADASATASAPPSSNPRGKRYQPALTKPRPLVVGPDGRVEFMAGIDENIRYNMGKSKVPTARVMSLPWNQAMLPEHEREQQQRRQAVAAQRRERTEVESVEAELRQALRKDERGLWRAIAGQEAHERAMLASVKKRQKPPAGAKAAPPAAEPSKDDGEAPATKQAEEEPASSAPAAGNDVAKDAATATAAASTENPPAAAKEETPADATPTRADRDTEAPAAVDTNEDSVVTSPAPKQPEE